MNWFLAGAVPPWAGVVGACMILLVGILGYLAGWARGLRAALDELDEEVAADRWVRRIRPPEVAHERPPRQRRTSTAAFLDPDQAHEAWLAHTEQAMDVANDDPTVSAWTEGMAARMDAFLAGLLADHPVPDWDRP